MTPARVVGFWQEAGRRRWFRRDPAFDAEVRLRLGAAHLSAAAGEFHAWGDTAEGALALLLLLDQVPRNVYRGSAEAYATDPLALNIAKAAVDEGRDLQVVLELQPFFYLPFEHDEASASQVRSVALFTAFVERGGEESYLRFARLHAELITRFGRFPHRNALLGHTSTPEELAYMEGGGCPG